MGALFGTRVDIRSRFFRPTSIDAKIAAQRVEMILNTRRGTFWLRPDYGLLVEDFVNADLTPAAFVRLAAQIKDAIAADDLFAEATITVSVKSSERRPGGLALAFRATVAFAGIDPVQLGINVSPDGVTVAGG